MADRFHPISPTLCPSHRGDCLTQGHGECETQRITRPALGRVTLRLPAEAERRRVVTVHVRTRQSASLRPDRPYAWDAPRSFASLAVIFFFSCASRFAFQHPAFQSSTIRKPRTTPIPPQLQHPITPIPITPTLHHSPMVFTRCSGYLFSYGGCFGATNGFSFSIFITS